jgi:IS5 family transposase
VAGLNEALLAKAAAAKLLRVDRVRAVTTVIPANVAYPTDSGLLAKAVGKLVRAARRVQAAGGATRTRIHDRRQTAGRRVRQIAARLRSRAKQAKEQSTAAIARATGQLADLAQTTVAETAAVLRNGHRALRRVADGRARGRLRRALTELAATIVRTRRIAAQARTRLAGKTPDGASRLVSLHDPDARPIRKGRTDRPVEFGYKAQVLDNDDGVVLDHTAESGAAPDAPQLAPAVERIRRRTGQPPAAVTADRGYGESAVDDDLAALGVRTIAIPRKGPPRQPGGESNTGPPSAGWSSGAPAARDASAASNAATAGIAPASTDAKAPPSGADTASSPTTWSRSALLPPDPAGQADPPPARPPRRRRALHAGRLLQAEVVSGRPGSGGRSWL